MNSIQARATQIRLVVADLAGTTVDYGSRAPVNAFSRLFEQEGLTPSEAQVRSPMGMHKRDHIRSMLCTPELSRQWKEKKGREWDEEDVNRMFDAFLPMQLKCLPDFNDLIPGVADTVNSLQEQGIRVAATTGYNEEMLEVVLKHAARNGFVPDAACSAAQVPQGRPAPWMIFRCMEAAGVYPPAAVVKIGDTLTDVEAGLNAGVWSVGVARTGNMCGESLNSYNALPQQEREARLRTARDRLKKAGAHYVIDTFAECAGIIREIETRLADGERP